MVPYTELSRTKSLSEPWVEIHRAMESLGNIAPLTSVWAGFHSRVLTRVHLRIAFFAPESKCCSVLDDYRINQMP